MCRGSSLLIVLALGTGGCQRLMLPDVEIDDVAAPAVAELDDDEAPPLAVASSDRCDEAPEACVRKGVALTRTDLPRAAGLFEDACAAGSPAGCGNLGVLVLDGRGVARDDDRARALFRRACNEGDTRSCDNLASL